MIIALILTFIASTLGMILSFVPTVTVAQIPIVGVFLATNLSLAVAYMNTAVTIIPFLAIVWQLFLYVVLPFELGLLLLKVFLGSRLPAHIN